MNIERNPLNLLLVMEREKAKFDKGTAAAEDNEGQKEPTEARQAIIVMFSFSTFFFF